MVTFVCVVTTKVTDWAGLNRPALFLNFYRTTVINNKISAMVNTQTKITKDFFDKYQNLLTETKNPNLLEFFF